MQVRCRLRLVSSLVMGGALVAFLGDGAFAQIIPDTTLGSDNSRVTPMTPTVEQIDGGATRGANVFHSFQEFNVGEGRSAYFTNPSGIENILTRITGANPSNILGTLGISGGNANLFLINPNGIIFGQNARLDVGGSFVASTASSLNFADGTQFSATAPQTTPLLTVSVPIGLQFGTTGGSIRNESQATNSSGETVGLQVQPGKTLALVGGNVSLDGGKLQALGGRVELGGVAGSGTVGLNVDGNTIGLSFPDGVALSDVSLTHAFVKVTAGDGGSITINARNLDILGNSELAAGIGEGLGTVGSQAGDITLNATEAITIGQSSSIRRSSIKNEVGFDATGNSGDINIKAGSLLLNSANLSTTTSGQGDAGSVSVQVNGNVSFAYNNIISSNTDGQGDAGSVSVQTNGDLSFENSSLILSYSTGEGDAGSVSLQANGNVSFAYISGISSNTDGQGDAGSVSVQANGDVSFVNGFISSTTSGQGNAGSILVQTNGNVSFADFSSLDSDSLGAAGTLGDAGSITVRAKGDASFADISGISSATEGEGDAGRITVQVNGDVSLTADSYIRNEVRSEAEGKGSTIHIQARSLSLSDGSRLFAWTLGSGNAGNIQVDAVDSVTLSGIGVFGSTGLFINTEGEPSSQGGDITIRTGVLRILDRAVLSARTRSNFDGGNITVDVNTLEIRGGGQMLTTAFSTGNAGSITVNATDSITLSGSDPTYSDRLAKVGRDFVDPASPASGLFSNTVADSTGSGGTIELNTTNLNISDGAGIGINSSGRGSAGSLLSINARDAVTIDNGFISSQLGSQAVGQGGTISLQARVLSLANGAEVNVSSQGLGNAGELRVEADSISLVNGGKLQASTASGLGGNIELQVQDLILMRLHSLISANAENNGNGGNVTINAPFIVAVKSENSDIIANAFQGRGGNINITTQGIYGLEYRPQLTPNSDINASSRFGVNGTVQINTPGIDPSRGLANLPTEVVDASNQIAQTCAAGGGEVGKNEFIVTGRRGMPSNPYEMLSNERPLEDIHPPSGFSSSRNSKPDAPRSVTPQSATSNPKPPIVEAQGWEMNDKGQVVLTATASTATPHNSLPASATCPST